MLLTAYLDARTTNFFHEIFQRGSISCLSWKILRRSRRNGCSYKKGGLGRNKPCIGDLTWQAASSLLGLASIPSATSWWGLCLQPNWAPYWLGTRARTPGDCSWSLQPKSTGSHTPGSLLGIFGHQRLASSNALACPWWSLEELLTTAPNWPISYQKRFLRKTPQLVGVLVELPRRRRGLNLKCHKLLGVPGTKKEE